jgi:hypothetical protein
VKGVGGLVKEGGSEPVYTSKERLELARVKISTGDREVPGDKEQPLDSMVSIGFGGERAAVDVGS